MIPGTTSTVGVIVPAYNAELWVAATLVSLQAQTWTDWYCVVVDDGSVDATAAIIAEFAAADGRIHLIRQANAGLPAARNSGLRELPDECEYVAFLDSDDLYEPDAIESLVDRLSRRPDAVGAYGLADYVDENGELMLAGLHPSRQRDRRSVDGWRLRDMARDADATFATMVVSGPIWPPAVALQRLADVRAIGGFDTSFASQEDWDFYVRLSRRGPYVSLDRRLALYRRHSTNMSDQHDLSVFQQERVRRNAFVFEANSRLETRQVANAWRYLEARQAAVLAKNVMLASRHGRMRQAGRYAVGSVVCGMQVLRPGPPRASHRRVKYTRPASLPGAQLF